MVTLIASYSSPQFPTLPVRFPTPWWDSILILCCIASPHPLSSTRLPTLPLDFSKLCEAFPFSTHGSSYSSAKRFPSSGKHIPILRCFREAFLWGFHSSTWLPILCWGFPLFCEAHPTLLKWRPLFIEASSSSLRLPHLPWVWRIPMYSIIFTCINQLSSY